MGLPRRARLPPELIQLVIKTVTDRRDLKNIRLLNKVLFTDTTLNRWLLHHLFDKVVLPPIRVKLLDFIALIQAREDIAASIKSIKYDDRWSCVENALMASRGKHLKVPKYRELISANRFHSASSIQTEIGLLFRIFTHVQHLQQVEVIEDMPSIYHDHEARRYIDRQYLSPYAQGVLDDIDNSSRELVNDYLPDRININNRRSATRVALAALSDASDKLGPMTVLAPNIDPMTFDLLTPFPAHIANHYFGQGSPRALQKLQLSIMRTSDLILRADAVHFVQMLAGMSELTHLDLSFGDFKPDNVHNGNKHTINREVNDIIVAFDELNVVLPQLTKLCIYGVHCHAEHLASMIENHADTLRELQLENVLLLPDDTPDCLVHFFGMLRDSMQLDAIHLDGYFSNGNIQEWRLCHARDGGTERKFQASMLIRFESWIVSADAQVPCPIGLLAMTQGADYYGCGFCDDWSFEIRSVDEEDFY